MLMPCQTLLVSHKGIKAIWKDNLAIYQKSLWAFSRQPFICKLLLMTVVEQTTLCVSMHCRPMTHLHVYKSVFHASVLLLINLNLIITL